MVMMAVILVALTNVWGRNGGGCDDGNGGCDDGCAVCDFAMIHDVNGISAVFPTDKTDANNADPHIPITTTAGRNSILCFYASCAVLFGGLVCLSRAS